MVKLDRCIVCLCSQDLALEPAWWIQAVHTPLPPSNNWAPFPFVELHRQESLVQFPDWRGHLVGGGLCLHWPNLSCQALLSLPRGRFTVATVNLVSAKYLVRSCVGSRQKPQFPSRLDAFRKPPTPFQHLGKKSDILASWGSVLSGFQQVWREWSSRL